MSGQPKLLLWLASCFCGSTAMLPAGAEWAARSAAKIHASLGWTKREHVVSVVGPGERKEQDQASLWEDQDDEH